ncbi:phage tail assembly protein [Patescibacteria group bacterium]|nr:phage tail assembly protein [Patescibacteria group bacterium]
MDSKKIIKLKYPIPIPKEGGGTVQVSELSLSRLKAKHLRVLPKDFMENEGGINPVDIIPLLASMTDIPESSADELDMEDLMVIAEELTSFLGQSLKTGKS